MPTAKIITRELEVLPFQNGIFMSDADLLSLVAVYSHGGHQTLQNATEEQRIQPSRWMSYAGPAGIGQYSLRRGKPAGVLARFDAHFRHTTTDEMTDDFNNFGEQVLGPEVCEVAEADRVKYKNNGLFYPFGNDEQFYFVGPPRLIKSVFISRVFLGDIPDDVSELVSEVDAAAETGEMITSQGYQFLHSRGGRIQYLAFGKDGGYDKSKLRLFGTIEMSDRLMLFYPNGDRRQPIDFTSTIYD